MSERHAVAAAAAAASLSAVLALGACGGTDPTDSAAGERRGDGPTASATASPAASSGGGGAGNEPRVSSNEADVAFLTAMVPHHQQAVEMSEIVLAAQPPAPLADLARQIKAAQDPEIRQMERMLADLGAPQGGGSAAGGHAGGHGGMLSEADMARLRAATDTEAARLYLEGMIAHHRGAIESSEAQLEQGEYEPALELARSIAETQAAEITRMEQLLRAL